MNGVWFGAALAQPRYGNKISSTGGLMSPSTAGLLNTFFSTTILAAFITTVAAVVGQIATRKAIARDSKGVSLGLFTLRSWIYVSSCNSVCCIHKLTRISSNLAPWS